MSFSTNYLTPAWDFPIDRVLFPSPDRTLAALSQDNVQPFTEHDSPTTPWGIQGNLGTQYYPYFAAPASPTELWNPMVDAFVDLSTIHPLQEARAESQADMSPSVAYASQTSSSVLSESSSRSPSFHLSPFTSVAVLPSPTTSVTNLQSSQLDERRAKILSECDASPAEVRNAVSYVIDSLEWRIQGDIQGDLLLPIIEAINFPNGGRSGSRGGIDRYRCRYGTCTKVIKRRDHMLNHVRCHLGLKPWVCHFIPENAHKPCQTRFLRIDDLKRHLRHIHKHDMDDHGNYFPAPNRVKQVRGPRKSRRGQPYPAQDSSSDDEYKPYGMVAAMKRGRHSFGRRYGPHGRVVNWYARRIGCSKPINSRLSCSRSKAVARSEYARG